MHRASILLVLFAFFAWPVSLRSNPATTRASADQQTVAALAERYADRLQRSRYMERGTPSDITLDGWAGFPIKRYTYSVTDKDGTVKQADVVLLDPSAEQIARWIVSAVTEVKGSYDEALARKAFDNIIAQSGGQFPVAGVVYEDIIPADGVHEVYCFRDGVTVAVDGIAHRETHVLSPAEVEASIHGKVTRIFTYARIASTTPQWFIAAGGDPKVLDDAGKPTAAWPLAIRKAYQDAWGNDRNVLIVAWVKANAT